jgi:colicin import membrane protein
MGFLREHLRPLLGSVALHVAIAGAVGGVAWLGFVRQPPPVRTVQAYVVRDAGGSRVPPVKPKPVVEPPAEVAPPENEPQPPDARAVAEAEQRREAQERAAAAARERRAADEKAAAEKAAAAEQRRAEEARDAAAEAAKRKAAAEEAARRKAEDAKRQADAKAKAEADARRKAEDAARKAREDELARQLADEVRREGARSAGLLDRYVADITAAVERAWNRPPGAKPGIRCTVYVSQVPGGVVTDARVGECNGDDAVRQSIVSAVYRASPLPAPPDASLFERKLQLVFAPDD